MPSTIRRGASWTNPSSGRTSRRNGAQGRLRRQASDGASSTMRSDALGLAHADLERDAPAHAVADDVRALELERVEQLLDAAREERRVIGGARSA